MALKDRGAESVEVATLHNLGGIEHARERYSAGERFARRAVEIRERLLGPDHPDTAADVAALAGLLDGQKRYRESEPLSLRARDVRARLRAAALRGGHQPE